MRIAVIDGKGGGIGSQVVERLKSLKNDDIEIIALGTNSQATSNMLKSGADDGSTGENAVIWMSSKVDVIIGPLAIISANSMMGEISSKMAEAVSSSNAKKILLPVSKCNIDIVGLNDMQFKTMFNELLEKIKELLNEK